MKYLFFLLFPITLFSQSKCDRNTAFTADFIFQSNPQVSSISGAVNLGVSGFNKVDERYNRLSFLTGLKIYNSNNQNKLNINNEDVFITPTATILLKHRFNGYDSKLVHVLGLTAGNELLEGSYRIYGAPTGNSFATVGVIFAYNNKQGFTLGFIVMGLF